MSRATLGRKVDAHIEYWQLFEDGPRLSRNFAPPTLKVSNASRCSFLEGPINGNTRPATKLWPTTGVVFSFIITKSAGPKPLVPVALGL